jgi:hypothetical protein
MTYAEEIDVIKRKWQAMVDLRIDAIERGMIELAISYGFAAIRLGEIMLRHQELENAMRRRERGAG